MQRFTEFTDRYSDHRIARIYAQPNGANWCRAFICMNDEFIQSLKRNGIERKFTVRNTDGWITDTRNGSLYELNEESKQKNPILYYIFEQLSKKGSLHHVDFFTGWTSATDFDFIFTDIDELVEYLGNQLFKR